MALPSGNRELLKHFKVLKFLGKGSYGSVYKVKRISDDKIYAVKETDVKSMSQTEREESVNEIRLLASASHPNIVSYNEAFLDGNRLCIVMEYAPNGDMSRIIKKQATARKPFEEMQIWKYFIQIARGINALHDMRVLHRDIKPGNIMVADGDVLKIGDLGIAKLLKSSMAKTQIGTPHYMPPEVWKSRPYAFPSDVWALGCILYEMATFNVPFEARSMSELRYKILRGRYSPVGRQYSPELIDMIRRLLDAVPENRPTLKQILASETVKKMEAKIRMEANEPVAGNQQMLATIQVPRNLNLLKGKFPEPNYDAEQAKENMAPSNAIGGLPAIKEAPRERRPEPSAAPRDLRARVPSRGEPAPRARAPAAQPGRAPSAQGGRVPPRPEPPAALQPRGGYSYDASPYAQYYAQQPPHNPYAYPFHHHHPQPRPPSGSRAPSAASAAAGGGRRASEVQRQPHLYGSPYLGMYQAAPPSSSPYSAAQSYLPAVPGASRNGAPPSVYGQPQQAAQYGRRAAQPSAYEAQRQKVAPPPRGAPAYPGAPAGVSRVGSRAGGKPYADYGRQAAYPPAYMQRQAGAGAPPAQYPFSRAPYAAPPRNYYAQPSQQRHRPVYHQQWH